MEDEISIPNITNQILDYYDAELFQDLPLEVTSNPKYYYDNQESSHGVNSCGEYLDAHSILSNQNEHMTNNPTSTNNNTTITTTTTAVDTITRSHHLNNHHEIMLASQSVFDSDISNLIDFSTTPQCNLNIQPDPYKLELSDFAISSGLKQYPSAIDPTTLSLIPPLGPLYGDDSLSSIPPFSSLNPLASVATSSSAGTFPDPALLQADINTILGTTENSGLLTENFPIPFEFKPKDLDFQADNSGIFSTDQLTSDNSGKMQAFSNENLQLVSAETSSAPIIINTDDSIFKVRKSAEERKEKLQRYLKKRNERNFDKKIQYAFRKRIADSRPRVRGRFVKNDECGDSHSRHTNNHDHDHDDDEELTNDNPRRG